MFNKIQLTVFTLFMFVFIFCCGYCPDPLRFTRFPLTPSFHFLFRPLAASSLARAACFARANRRYFDARTVGQIAFCRIRGSASSAIGLKTLENQVGKFTNTFWS